MYHNDLFFYFTKNTFVPQCFFSFSHLRSFQKTMVFWLLFYLLSTNHFSFFLMFPTPLYKKFTIFPLHPPGFPL